MKKAKSRSSGPITVRMNKGEIRELTGNTFLLATERAYLTAVVAILRSTECKLKIRYQSRHSGHSALTTITITADKCCDQRYADQLASDYSKRTAFLIANREVIKQRIPLILDKDTKERMNAAIVQSVGTMGMGSAVRYFVRRHSIAHDLIRPGRRIPAAYHAKKDLLDKLNFNKCKIHEMLPYDWQDRSVLYHLYHKLGAPILDVNCSGRELHRALCLSDLFHTQVRMSQIQQDFRYGQTFLEEA